VGRYKFSRRICAAAVGVLIGAALLPPGSAHAASDPVHIREVYSTLYADPAGRGVTNGTHIHTWTLTEEDYQLWVITQVVSVPGSFTLTNKHSGRCLSVSGASMKDAAPIILWDCNGTPDQYWSWLSRGDGWNYLVNYNSGRCLSVIYGHANDINQDLIQWTCHRGYDQAWEAI
jgi:hypothetical protein